MALPDHLPAAAALLIVTTAFLAGPVFGIPGTQSEPTCSADAFPGAGNATISVTELPESASLDQARFGADVYRLNVPNADVDVADLEGRPTVAYKIIIHELTVTTGSSTILSRCHNTTELSIPESTFEPDKIDRDSYNATLKVIYRGTESGEKVEQELATKNITVEVTE